MDSKKSPNKKISHVSKTYNKYSLRNVKYPDKKTINSVLNSVIPNKYTLPVENFHLLTENGYHQYESGYSLLPDGTGYIAFHLSLPDITPEMFDWFFSWHPVDSDRYKIWNPEEHISVYVDNDDRKQLLNSNLPYNRRLWGVNVIYREKTSEEIIHDSLMSYHSPAECGIECCSKTGNNWTAVCANEGSICHFVRETKGGSELRSRIWTGVDTTEAEKEHLLPESFHHPDEMENYLKETALHYITDFTNLSVILPSLFRELETF